MFSGAISPNSDTHNSQHPWRTALVWLAVGVLWRASLAALVPPVPDETYYWEWTRHLQLSYFDHPPVIALLIRAGTLMFGDTQFGIRAGPAIAGLVASVCVVMLATNLQPVGVRNNTATRAAVITSVLPLATLGLVLATPDSPLIAIVALALLSLERALNAQPATREAHGWWLCTGIATGIALDTKYTAVLLPISFLIAALFHSDLRKRFREPGPYVAGIVALVVFLPVVIWNARNNWISFRFQLDHGFSPAVRGTGVGRELEYIGAQLGLASPILFVLLAAAVMQAARAIAASNRNRDEIEARRYAVAMATIIPVAFFAVSAWKRPVEANWPALMYPGAMALLASSTATWANGKWWKWAVGVAIAFGVVATAQAIYPVLPIAASKDPIARAYGFDLLAAQVERAKTDSFFTKPGPRLVATTRYEVSAQMSFRLSGQPYVYCIWLDGRPNQYDFWQTFFDAAKPGDDLVVVLDADPHGDLQAGIIGKWFERFKLYETVSLARNGGVVKRRRVWLFRNATHVPSEMARLPSEWAPR